MLAALARENNHARRFRAALVIELRTVLAVRLGAAIGGMGPRLVTQLVVARAGAAAAPWAMGLAGSLTARALVP